MRQAQHKLFILQLITALLPFIRLILAFRFFLSQPSQPTFGPLFFSLLGLAFGILLGFFPGVIFHELAHLLAGLLAGMRLDSLEIGSHRFYRTDRGWERERKGREEGGEARRLGGVSMAPSVKTSRRGMAFHFLSGGLANLFFALLFFLLSGFSYGFWPLFLFGLGIINFYLGGSNLLPLRRGSFYTDGDLVSLLSQKGGDRFYQTLLFSSQIDQGSAPWDLPYLPPGGGDPLTQAQEACIAFLQLSSFYVKGEFLGEEIVMKREVLLQQWEEVMAVIRPHPAKPAVANMDLDQLLSYAAIYDSLLGNKAQLEEDFAAYGGRLAQADSLLAHLAAFLREWARGDGWLPGEEEKLLSLRQELASDLSLGMRQWSLLLLEGAEKRSRELLSDREEAEDDSH